MSLLLPSFATSGLCFVIVQWMRPDIATLGLGDFMSAILLGSVFVLTYFLLIALVARTQARSAVLFVTSKVLPRKEVNA
jgi:hypothetical protein